MVGVDSLAGRGLRNFRNLSKGGCADVLVGVFFVSSTSVV